MQPLDALLRLFAVDSTGDVRPALMDYMRGESGLLQLLTN